MNDVTRKWRIAAQRKPAEQAALVEIARLQGQRAGRVDRHYERRTYWSSEEQLAWLEGHRAGQAWLRSERQREAEALGLLATGSARKPAGKSRAA